MKQGGVGEDAVETVIRQAEREKVLLPYLAPAMRTGHRSKARGAFQTDRDVPERGKRHEVAPRPAAEVEDRERRLALNESQQRRDVLADVVIARAAPELLGMPVVMSQRAVGDRPQDRESGVIHGADDRTADILSIRSAR